MLTEGTYADKAREAMEKAEAAEARANRIKASWREYLKDEWKVGGTNRGRELTDKELGIRVDQKLATDPKYKLAVADNRWYLDQVIAYSNLELMHLLAVSVSRTSHIRL